MAASEQERALAARFALLGIPAPDVDDELECIPDGDGGIIGTVTITCNVGMCVWNDWTNAGDRWNITADRERALAEYQKHALERHYDDR
jgi:hypothetical protein